MSNIATLPQWKKGSSPGEWLSECAGMAFENPERWAKIAIVFTEMNENIPKKTRYHCYGIPSNSELLGQLEVGKLLVFDALRGRD